ncbi:MAG: hypothetical protein PVI00_16695, partial [Desulfobacterales bacterium]
MEKYNMRIRWFYICCVCVAFGFFLIKPLLPVKMGDSAHAAQLELFQALMAEDIFSNAPHNPTGVFSVKQKKAICFSAFSHV